MQKRVDPASTRTSYLTLDDLPFSHSLAYSLHRNGKLILRKLGRRSVVLRTDYEAFLKALPKKEGISEAHRAIAQKRWNRKVN